MIFSRGMICIFICFVSVCESSRRGYGRGTSAKPKTTSCGLTKLQAGDNLKEFTSPGYPGVFSEQTQCSWKIEAPLGSRVKLKIKDFFLLNQHVCGVQYVDFRDHFSGQHYGPLCGRRQPEDLVSAGNSVTVRLESDTVGHSNKFRGFKIYYMKTYDPPTLQMRDSDGKWKKYDVPTTATTLAPPIEPTDNIVDKNDNENINRKNQIKNKQNDEEARKMTTERITTVTTETQRQKIQPTIKTTTHPGLWMRTPIYLLPTKRPPIRQQYPANRTPQSENDNENTGAKAGTYLAIILAFLIVAGVVFFIFYKRRRKKSKRDNKIEELPCNISIISKNNVETELPPLKQYRSHNYEMVTPLGKTPSIKKEKNVKRKPAENNNFKNKEEKCSNLHKDRRNHNRNRHENKRKIHSKDRIRDKHKTATNNNTLKHHRRERPGEKRDKTTKSECKTSPKRKQASDRKTEKNSSSDNVKSSRNIHRNRRHRKPENDHHKSSENRLKRTSANRQRSKDASKQRRGHRKEDKIKNRDESKNPNRHSKSRRSEHNKTKIRHRQREKE